MFESVLLPIAPDHRVEFDKLLSSARRLCGDTGKISVLTVVEDIPKYFARDLPPEYRENLVEKTKAELNTFLAGNEDLSLTVRLGHASTEIIRFANDNKVDCIVLASRRPEFSDLFLGSTATRVARRSDCTVMIVR